MARRLLLLLLPALAFVLFAELAGPELAGAPWNRAIVALEPAKLGSDDLSPESRPTLTRGGFVMAAVESSRRKLRFPQRPATQPLILTSRVIADRVVRSLFRARLWSEPPLKLARPARPFLARGPPIWNFL